MNDLLEVIDDLKEVRKKYPSGKELDLIIKKFEDRFLRLEKEMADQDQHFYK